MQLPLPLLGLLAAISGHAFSSAASESNTTYFGAPRYSIEGVLPVFDIAERYIRSQTDGSAKVLGSTAKDACSRSNPCILGSCCNSDGHCGYRPEHCSPPAPKLCVANCDAKAPCGEFSVDGRTICPLNVCCSSIGFCGTSDLFCRDKVAAVDGSLCLGGNCGAINAPSCGKSSGTVSRRIAYYQSWNSRRRPCDKVLPSQLDVSSLTHLVLAFATIDAKTFEVRPMNPDDEDIYKQFLALPDSVSKWIGIGGFEFTDPGATRYTWSDMTSSKENRKAFIDSLQRFLSKWNFRGVDIDWEWPGHESRGGRPQDGVNQAELLREMRHTLGSNFGLGVVIPAQFEYMKNMDIKSLEAQVDWLTILTYDLHGAWDLPWDPKIKPHTDLKEIDESLKLLWSNNIDSKKVNMGIANYGRGYTVADKSCMYYGCTFTGPSKAGSCTLQDGVLSTCEIQRLINEKHLTYKVVAGGAEANEVTWDDQWVSFDDASTLGRKLELASDRCLGGTALWAIDYATCSGDDSSPQPGPSQPVSKSVPLVASSSTPPVDSLQSSPAWPSAVSSSSQGTSAASSSPPTTSPQSSSHIEPSGPVVSSSSPALPSPVPPSEVSSPTLTIPTSAPWVSSSPSQGTSAAQSSIASNTQGSSRASPSGSQTTTEAATSSSSISGTSIPASISSSISSSIWSSSQAGSSGQTSLANQPSSPVPWSSSGATSSTLITSSIAWSTSVVAPSESSVDWSSSANAPSGSSSSSTLSSANQASSMTSLDSSSQFSSSGQLTSIVPSTQTASVPWISTSNSATASSGSGTAISGSSSDSQGISGSATSSAILLSSSWNQASSSSSAVSSVVASPSAPQFSGAQSSTEQTSAAETSAGASSQPADLPKSASSSGNATPTTPERVTVAPSGSGGATSVIATIASSSMILPPPVWACPVECQGKEWCNAFCHGERPWPPPTQCWWFDWCMLWWGFTTVKKTTPEKPECKLLGCGCGFMGLPWGPGCPNETIPFPINIIIRIFGLFPTPCLFWGCGSNCGILGCGGWCFGKDGCTECPKLLCPNGGPKPGPIPSTFPPLDPPGPTGDDGKPKACDTKDIKTATERFVYCGEYLYLSSAVSATTLSSVVSTSISTSTSSSSTCHTVFDVTLFGCNVKDHLETMTTSVTESNTLSNETPGPACTRAPLSLDDDEGNNIPVGWDLSSITFASNTTDISSPTSTPTSDCSKCWEYFDKTCIPQRCKLDDPENCAFRCLSDMCLAPNSPELCWTGHSCAHKSCPNDTMGALPSNFTATLTFSAGPTLTVTLPSSSAYSKTSSSSSADLTSFQIGTSTTAVQVGTSQIPKPTPGPMDKNGVWKVSVHVWMEGKAAKIECELYDPNGNKAGENKMFPHEGNESIEIYIESDKGRAFEHSMPFGVKAWFNNPITIDKARVEFEIQKNMPNCDKIPGVPCKPQMETENKLETSAFFVDVCWQYCDPKKPEDRLLNTWDLDCQDLNDADWQQSGNAWVRNFDCHWKGF